jgi:hypothetical protein
MTTRAPIAYALPRLAALMLCATLPACASEPRVRLHDRSFAVEIADDPQEQAQGLMFRHRLDDDRGMLFVYSSAQPQAFWMRNCYIALDILYFDEQGRFINGHYEVPPCQAQICPSYPSAAPARYVLEVKGGVARAMNLAKGDQLTLPD